jgi:hypothetical protein
MNLRSWSNNESGGADRSALTAGFSESFRRVTLFPQKPMSSLFRRFYILAATAGIALNVVSTASAQTNFYVANGMEYAVVGSLPGDQVMPDAALSAGGGMLVWQDNATDGSGLGLSARRLDTTLSGTLSTFRVNVTATNDQENARVAQLKNGGSVFVWQGGKPSFQHIYARFLSASNTWLATNLTSDLPVSSMTNFQISPAVAVLNNSNVVVVWSSLNQVRSNSLQDVYGKILSPSGATVKSEFLINQFTNFNQRTPAVVALKDGGFGVVWVSEQQRILAPALGANSPYSTADAIRLPSVDIYARLFRSNGVAAGSEFLVNANNSPCANPAAAAAPDGTFMVAWSGRDTIVDTNGWDVYARVFSSTGVGSASLMVNQHIPGNQYVPRIAALGQEYLLTWTSVGQDGSREGVFGRFVHIDGLPTGGEMRVNTTTASQQIQPVVASDGGGQLLVVWSSFIGGSTSFDLFAQRFINVDAVLSAMPAPFVYTPFTLSNNVYQPQLQVSWAPLAGISVSNYEVYVDGAATPAAVTQSNSWTMTAANGLKASTTHSFQVDYVKPTGARSPVSESASGSTWSGLHWQGIPYEWMTSYYGADMSQWPPAGSKVAAQGPSVMQAFLSGASPLDSSTWLTTQITNTKQGAFLSWNTQPGFVYQVQATTNFTTWSNWGAARFAAGNADSIYLGNNAVGFYRVLLVR